MKHKVILDGKEYLTQTSQLDLQSGETLLRSFSVEQLWKLHTLFAKEFNQMMDNKKSTELILDRLFKPTKYPNFHFHIEVLHELWLKDMGV